MMEEMAAIKEKVYNFIAYHRGMHSNLVYFQPDRIE